jgi:hypothetical protein
MAFGILSSLVQQVMSGRDFPQHLIRVVQGLCLGTKIIIDKQQFEIGKMVEIN